MKDLGQRGDVRFALRGVHLRVRLQVLTTYERMQECRGSRAKAAEPLQISVAVNAQQGLQVLVACRSRQWGQRQGSSHVSNTVNAQQGLQLLADCNVRG